MSKVITGGDFAAITETADGLSWTVGATGLDTADRIFAGIYANGKYLLCGQSNAGEMLITSSDGDTWASQTVGLNTSLYTLCASPSLFIVGGASGAIATSSDAISWSIGSSGFGISDIQSSIYVSGQYIIAGGGGQISTSTDGFTWTPRTNPFLSSDVIYSLSYGGGVYVATANSGKIASSTDGISWTLRTSNAGSNSLFGSCYGNGLFVAVGNAGTMVTSPDGTTWTARTSGFGTTQIRKVAYANSLYIAIGLSGKIATSANGTSSWTTRTSGLSSNLFGLAVGPSQPLLSASALTVGSPLIPSGLFSQKNQLSAAGLSTASLVIGSATLYTLQAVPLTVGSLVFDAPYIPNLYLGNMVVGPISIGVPAFFQIINYTLFTSPTFSVSSTVIGSPIETEVLSAADLTVGSPTVPVTELTTAMTPGSILVASLTIGAPAFAAVSILDNASNLIAGTPVIGAPAFAAFYIVAATKLDVGSPVIGSPRGGYNFIANEIDTGLPIVDLPTMALAITVSSFAVGSPSLGVPQLALAPLPIAASLVVGSPAIAAGVISHNNELAATNFAVNSPVINSAAFSFKFSLDASGLTVSSPSVPTIEIWTLATSGLTVLPLTNSIGNPLINQHYNLLSTSLTIRSPIFDLPQAMRNTVQQNFVVRSPVLGVPKLTPRGLLPTIGAQLLYRAASGLEKAIADTDAVRITAIDAEIIKDIWDPFACPLPLLPYLAWAMGVTFWNDQWSETTKRSWIAIQWQFKALRGTEGGLDLVIDYAGRDVSPFGYHVKKVITQPQQLFPGGTTTVAQREAWLAQLPQVRVYYFQQTGTTYRQKFFVRASWLGTKVYPVPSDAVNRLGRQATWNVNGVDTNVPVQDFGNSFQLRFFGTAGPGSFISTSILPSGVEAGTIRFLVPSTAWRRLVTIEPITFAAAPYRVSVGPSLQAVQSTPELVAQPGIRGVGMFIGSNYFHGSGVFMSPGGIAASRHVNPVFPAFLVPSTSRYRLFQRYAVYDPEDLPRKNTPSTMFMGIGRMGFPAFTAEVDVFMPSIDSQAKFRTNEKMMPHGRFMLPHNGAPLAYVASAAESARRLVDKLLLRTGPTPVFVAGAPFIADNDHFVVGQSKVSA